MDIDADGESMERALARVVCGMLTRPAKAWAAGSSASDLPSYSTSYKIINSKILTS